ncbi:hypothetical protein GIB67_025663 [Kingdonia uniflora]|uniref:PDZ-like domain-containing protein n=1 Tax=Kingdonia uniflora TaxID=39325 RepID=A0A7J7L8Q2_9MAGN|nr:hypothetical protein GIB67_025663 [Kingdonia uniflora]
MDDPPENFMSESSTTKLESTINDDLSMEIDPPFKENLASAENWRTALSKVVPAVVVLRTTACRAFDTDLASAGYATGFIVDKRRGIILTNRHVVKSGPVVSEATFVNREETPVYPIYRDPGGVDVFRGQFFVMEYRGGHVVACGVASTAEDEVHNETSKIDDSLVAYFNLFFISSTQVVSALSLVYNADFYGKHVYACITLTWYENLERYLFVHDFGFFRYDPESVKFLSYEEIPLAPEDACVGLEIRVVGNDSGEKVSILAGTLARLDRDAPQYKNWFLVLRFIRKCDKNRQMDEMQRICIQLHLRGCDGYAMRFQVALNAPVAFTSASVASDYLGHWDGYNDFNTFYLQEAPDIVVECQLEVVGVDDCITSDDLSRAASGTKGGSSGSPVINSEGRAVALNAGSKMTSSSAFFLPLERVVRALNLLQKGKDLSASAWATVAIPRGTLQTTFLHKGFDEIRRLGLRSETEEMIRHATPDGETGMLVVNSAVPGGPAHKHLEPGDVLVRVTGEVITQFLKLETLLDDNVDGQIDLQIERGGNTLTVQLKGIRHDNPLSPLFVIVMGVALSRLMYKAETWASILGSKVQDLHSITPNFFLEVSGAVIHPLSYQQARNFRFNTGLVYVAEPGYMLSRAGVPRHAIIKKFAGVEISQIDDFLSALSQLPRGARVPLDYVSYVDRHRTKSVLVTVDRHDWYAPPQIYTRNDSSGFWEIKEALPSLRCDVEDTRGSKSTNAEACILKPVVQGINQKLMSGSVKMPTKDDQVHKDSRSLEGLAVESKNRPQEEISIPDNFAVSEGTLETQVEEKLGKQETLEIDCFMDTQNAAPASTSFTERVVEPSLVMFEVGLTSPPWQTIVPSFPAVLDYIAYGLV